MKQVLIRKGQAILANIPAPLVEPGHVLVEVAFSLISTGTELGSVQSSGESLFRRAIKQPEKVKQVLDFYRSQGIKKTVAKVRGQVDQANPTGYSCSGVVIQVERGSPIFNQAKRSPAPGLALPIILRSSWYRAT